ncbi:hypothetical protein [Brucella pituitosa]|uniref:hypothetical protein n=1 Tax=Brucella pituitosa TaxID=571256 RepID=UPI0009A20B7B|nr:hypothetical protein [Brucella pituitosa]
MSNQILDVILSSAVRTGSEIVKDIVSAQLGPTIGGLAGTVVDTIAGSLAVDPEAIPTLPADQIDGAVVAAEDNSEILRLYVEQQRLTNDLLVAEINKSEALWTWAWRPAWMWFLMLVWFYVLLVAPIVSGITGVIFEIPELGVVVSLTITFVTLYMGGHTLKDIWGRK